MNTTIPVKNEKPFIDITDEWFENVVPNYNKFKERQYFSYKGNRYRVNGKTVYHEYKNNEKEVAQLLQEKLGGTIYKLPKVEIPKNIQTADYKYINHRLKFNDYLELKTIKFDGDNIIDNRLKKAKGQANNFVLYFTNPNMTYYKIFNQIERLYNNPCRQWINTIIIIKDDKIRVVSRKK